MTGREHWLLAEELLLDGGDRPTATTHALLALAAPAYAFHQAPREVVADSPNITAPAPDQPVIPTRPDVTILGDW